MDTFFARKEDVNSGALERKWFVVDADGKNLGRLATRIADVLRGRHKATWTPHVDVGDFVIVFNAEKIAVTGNKLQDKKYRQYSGYPGGLREETLGQVLEKDATRVITQAVGGMLPKKSPLARQQLTKLKVHVGPLPEHGYAAQKPEPFPL
jgi:large subunit ribosomal protein L13